MGLLTKAPGMSIAHGQVGVFLFLNKMFCGACEGGGDEDQPLMVTSTCSTNFDLWVVFWAKGCSF